MDLDQAARRPPAETAARQLVDRTKARPTAGLAEADSWLQSDDPLEVVAARWARGAAFFELGQNDQALVEFALAIDEGPDQLNDWVSISLAAAEAAAGRPEDASARLSRISESGRQPLASIAASQLGLVKMHQGQAKESLTLLEDSARTLRAFPGERAGLARVLGNAGHCGLILGRIRSAERHFLEAMDLALETQQQLVVAGLRQNLAYVRMCLGDLPLAIASYREAIDVYREIGGANRNLVTIYDDLAEAYRFAGLTRDALRYARLSLWTARQGSNVEKLADSTYRHAQCLYHHGNFDKAATSAQRAAEMFSSSGRDLWAVRSSVITEAAAAHDDAADQNVYARLDRLAVLAARLDELGISTEAVRARNIAAQMSIERGDAIRARALLAKSSIGEAAEAQDGLQYEHTIEVYELLFGRALLCQVDGRPLTPVLDVARARLQAQLQGLADAELRNGVARLATRFRTLALDEALADPVDPVTAMKVEETWRFAQQPSSRGADLALDRGDDAVVEHLGKLRLLYRQRRRKDDIDDELESRIKELEADIREMSMTVSTPAIESNQPAADDDSTVHIFDWLRRSEGLLVQLFEHRGAIHAVTADVGGVRHRVVGARIDLDDRLSKLGSSLGKLLRSPLSSVAASVLWDAASADAADLGRMLLGSVVPGQSVVVSCPAGFAPLPWSLMVDERCPISVITSSAVWSAEAPRIDTEHVSVVVGPDLTHGASDGSAVTKRLGAAAVLDGDTATSAALLHVFEHDEVVHVAAHSHFRPDNVMFSSLQMFDGPVHVYELSRLAYSPHLVVLAACEAGGTGGSEFGEWLGLVPELLRAGTECLVAPIRPIADTDAAVVMDRFYHHLSDNTVAEALAEVRVDLLDEAPRIRAAAHAFLAFGRGHAILA